MIHISRRALLGSAIGLGLRPNTSDANAGASLNVSATPSIFKPAFEELRREFLRRNAGVAIDLRVSARDQEDQIQSTLRQALIGALPDVSFEGLKYLRMLQRRRIAVPVQPLIDNDGDWREHDYSRSLLHGTRVGGDALGVGAAISLPIIYYDAERVTKALGGAIFPQDWAGLTELVAVLGHGARSGTLGGFIQHADNSWIYMSVVSSLGGRMMDVDERRVTLDDENGLQALQIFAEFGRAGQARLDMGREQARQAFAGGAVSLLIDSSSSLRLLERQIAGRFRLATAQLPLVPNGSLPANGIAAVVCARDPARQAAAWQFVKFVCGPVGQSILGKRTGYLPANDVVVRRSDLLAEHYRSRPLVRAVVDSLPFAAPWYSFPGRNAMKIDAVIVDGVASVVALSKTPRQAAAAMKRAIATLLPSRAT